MNSLTVLAEANLFQCEISFFFENNSNFLLQIGLSTFARFSVFPAGLHLGPGISPTLCCFVVYFTRRFVLCLTLCYFVLMFFSHFNIAITSLGEERAYLSAFRIGLFNLCLFGFVGFLFLLMSGKGCGLYCFHF